MPKGPVTDTDHTHPFKTCKPCRDRLDRQQHHNVTSMFENVSHRDWRMREQHVEIANQDLKDRVEQDHNAAMARNADRDTKAREAAEQTAEKEQRRREAAAAREAEKERRRYASQDAWEKADEAAGAVLHHWRAATGIRHMPVDLSDAIEERVAQDPSITQADYDYHDGRRSALHEAAMLVREQPWAGQIADVEQRRNSRAQELLEPHIDVPARDVRRWAPTAAAGLAAGVAGAFLVRGYAPLGTAVGRAGDHGMATQVAAVSPGGLTSVLGMMLLMAAVGWLLTAAVDAATIRGTMHWDQARRRFFASKARQAWSLVPAAVLGVAAHGFAAWWLLSGMRADDLTGMSRPGAAVRALVVVVIAVVLIVVATAVAYAATEKARWGHVMLPDLEETARLALAEIEHRQHWSSDNPGSDPLNANLRKKLGQPDTPRFYGSRSLVRPPVDDLLDERIEQLGKPHTWEFRLPRQMQSEMNVGLLPYGYADDHPLRDSWPN